MDASDLPINAFYTHRSLPICLHMRNIFGRLTGIAVHTDSSSTAKVYLFFWCTPMCFRLLRFLALSLVFFIMPFAEWDPSCRAAIIVASAGINLIVPTQSEVSNLPNTSVSASATTNEAISSASVNTDIRLGALGFSDGIGLVNNAGGTAHFNSGFVLSGNTSGQSVPLSFNFNLSGSLEATSDAASRSLTLGLASVTYDIQTSRTRFNGAAGLRSQNGVPFSDMTGQLLGDASLSRAAIVVTIGNDHFTLTTLELDLLGFDFLNSLDVSFDDVDAFSWIELAGQIARSIFDRGIPSRGIDPGVEADVGFDVGYSFDSAFSVLVDIEDTDALVISLSSIAAATENASGKADFQNTLTLTSITLPETYATSEFANLHVEFSSGLRMPVTFVQTVPEPGSCSMFAAFAIVAGLGFSIRHRLESQLRPQ